MRTLITTTVALVFIACAEDSDSLTGSDPPAAPDTPASTPGADPTQPGNCKVGAPHLGFANVDFVADRVAAGIGVDRRRVTPYSALGSGFQRSLGAVPAGLSDSAAAYGAAPARWYAEPTAGAISINVTYGLAFTTCYDTMTGATFAQVPTPETAAVECANLQRKIWQRTATPEESKACSDLVLDLADEPEARRRWAHGCAAIMTSAGFTSY